MDKTLNSSDEPSGSAVEIEPSPPDSEVEESINRSYDSFDEAELKMCESFKNSW